jgi:ABC-type sugar transport system permease subunit
LREAIVTNLLLTPILTFNYFDMISVLTRAGQQNAVNIFPTKIYTHRASLNSSRSFSSTRSAMPIDGRAFRQGPPVAPRRG